MTTNDDKSGSADTDFKLFYATIGQAISAWTEMESGLVFVASILIDTSPEKTGVILYSNQNFHLWLNVIDDLFGFEPKFGSLRKKWTTISADLRSMNDTRVRLAHHTRHHTDTDDTAPNSLMPAKFDLRNKSQSYKALRGEEILDFTEKLTTVTSKIVELVTAMTDIMRASLDKSSPAASDPPPADAQ